MKPFLRTLLDTDHPLGDLLAVAFLTICFIIALHL
jgi:hypothetical protein